MEITITKITDAIVLMATISDFHPSRLEIKTKVTSSAPKSGPYLIIKDITDIKTDGKTNSTALIITTQTPGPMWPGRTPKMITSTKKIPTNQIINIKIKD